MRYTWRRLQGSRRGGPRKAASSFVSEVVTPGRDSDTINKIVSTYRQLWKYLRREEVVAGENPWADQGPPKGAKVKDKRSGNGSDNRRPFTEEEAKAFLQGLHRAVERSPRYAADRDVSMLVAVTGMRIEEACSLLCSDLKEGKDVLPRQEAGPHRASLSGSEN